MGAIVEATRDLLSKVEPEQLSMKAIATRAGVGVGSLYDYFSGREGILHAVQDRIDQENFEVFVTLLRETESLSLEEMFDRFVDVVFERYLDQAAAIRAAIRVILRFGLLRHVVARRDRVVELIVERVQREVPGLSVKQATPSVRTLTDMLMGAIVSELYRSGAELRDAERREALRAVIRRATVAELSHLRTLPT